MRENLKLEKKRKIKVSSTKSFKGSADPEFYSRGYFLEAVGSNYGRGPFSPYDETYLARNREIAKRLITAAPRTQKVLVLGAARGYLVKAFRERGVDAVGVDISQWAVENCAEGIEDYMYCGDICDLSAWKDDEFDLVVALDVLEHIRIPDLFTAIGEAVRVGQMVLLDVPILPHDDAPDQSAGTDKSHVSCYSNTWWITRFMERGMEPFGQPSEYTYPEEHENSPWPDGHDHGYTVWFRKPLKQPTPESIGEITIAPNSKDFKVLWYANAHFCGCFDVETEVLTNRGWIYFKDLTFDDEIATLNPDTKELEYHKPDGIINMPYDGLMYHHESKHLDMITTPNHKLYVKKRSREDFELIEAQDIFGKWDVKHFCGGAHWVGESPDSYIIPRQTCKSGKIKHVDDVNTSNFMAWLGWYIAEGSYTLGAKGEYIVSLALNKNESDEALDVCRRTFPTLTWFKTEGKHKDNVRTYSKDLYYYVKPLGRSHEKHVPKDVKNFDAPLLHTLLGTLTQGDGRKNGTHILLYTSSKQLRDDIMEIGLKLGYGTKYALAGEKGDTHLMPSENRVIHQRHDSWRVSLYRKQKTPRTVRNKFIEEWIPNPTNRVYCAVVKNHIMAVRRNGKAYFSGNTGYGVGTAGVIFDLLEHYHVRNLAFYGLEGKALGFNNLITYPKRFCPFGSDAAKLIVTRWKPDILVTLFDIWIDESGSRVGGPGWLSSMHPRWVPIIPVDHDPIPPPVLSPAQKAYRPVAMSRFGQRQLEKNGVKSTYIPHGVDTSLFKPSLDKVTARQHLQDISVPLVAGKEEPWPEDCFVIGKVAANKDTKRKGFDIDAQALRIFFDNNPDAQKDTRVFMLTLPRFPGGFNIDHWYDLCGVSQFVKVIDEFFWYQGLAQEDMPKIYAGFDVLLNASRAEGFGIPIIEAASTGVPTIATDFTAMTELVEGHGWLIKKYERDLTPALSFTAMPDKYELAEHIADAYNNPDKVARYGAASRDFALNFDWKKVVVPLWIKLFEEIREEIRPKTLSERRLMI